MVIKKKGIARWVTFILFLTCADQLIKLIIYHNYMAHTFPIIENFISFTPHFNEDISWFNAKYDLNMGLGIITLLTIAVLIFALYQAKIHYMEYQEQTLAVAGYSTFISGVLASVLDKILWGTSLDYIKFRNWFIFDLKDLYLDLGSLLFMIGYIIFEVKKHKALGQEVKG